MSAVLELEGVDKRVLDGRARRTILSGISLTLAAGELVVVAGPSGSGKSTLLSVAGAMSVASAGRVTLLGKDVARLRDGHRAELRRSGVGFVFQELGLIGGMTLLENLSLPLVPTGGASPSDRQRIAALLSEVGLSERQGERAGTASGGERQRLAVARALVRDPKLLILDEPTAHLDPDNVTLLLGMLAAEKAKGRALLLSTHDPRVIAHAAVDRVLRMDAGRIVTLEA